MYAFHPNQFRFNSFFFALSDFVSIAFTNTHMPGFKVFFVVYFFITESASLLFLQKKKKLYSFVLSSNNTSPSTSTCLTIQPSLVHALVWQNWVLTLFWRTFSTLFCLALHTYLDSFFLFCKNLQIFHKILIQAL